MIESQSLLNTLFLDIETVSTVPVFDNLDERFQKEWQKKSRQFTPDRVIPTLEDAAQYYESKAGIFSEFAKIVCISVGYLVEIEGSYHLRIKSFASDDENEILTEFSALVEQHYNQLNVHKLCGHNIKEFDIPFIARRLVIHGMPLPQAFQIAGKKPWQLAHLLDTMELWRFGDYKNYTSLSLLATALNIPTPKDDIDGSQVGHVYWNEKNLERIAIYCQKDVVTVAQVLLKMMRLPTIDPENIEIINGQS